MSAISQVRREGQGLPRSVCVAWCPENSPFLFWGFSLSIYKMGASEAVIAGWELDTQGARVISMHCWGLSWLELVPGTRDLGTLE